MSKRIRNHKIILQDLSPVQVSELEVELYDLFGEIFGNVSFEEFQSYVTHSGASKTTVMVYRNDEDQAVGFFALHIYKKKIQGKNMIIYRGQLGLLQEYRRQKANMYFGLIEVVKSKIFYPFTPVYTILSVINPSMYSVLAKNMIRVIPRYNQKVSEKQKQKVLAIAREFNFPAAQDEFEWTAPIGWVSKSSKSEQDFWRTSENPHIQYYQKLNPKFAEGNGLVTLIPFSWNNMLASSFKIVYYMLKKKLKK